MYATGALSQRLGITLLLAALWLSQPGCAASLETLLMPGELSNAHRKYEADCDVCHQKFRKADQSGQCTACHDHQDVARDIERGKGFHGRLDSGLRTRCVVCHTEHQGRGADIVNLDTATFDHAHTDFALLGAHAGIECRACHRPHRKYREAASECHACHAEDDAHAGRLGKACSDCHDEKAWRKTGFDHAKTRFALEGKHEEVLCVLCHPDNRYKGVPDKCNSCHGKDDVHNGRYGQECAECHAPKGWSGIAFDHDRKSDFPLRGAHKDVSCRACHGNDVKADKREKTCASCHAQDDLHKGRNGRKCGSCHNEKNWKKSTFDHDKTRFRLSGKHRRLNCVACHKGDPKQERDRRACNDCHAISDVHKGHAGAQCGECHTASGWGKLLFEHGRDTRFALRGRHAKLECLSCHVLPPKEQALATTCYDCHRRDDVHAGREGRRCDDCHNERSWLKQVRFDHDLSSFPLIGQHALASCEACHLSTDFKDVNTTCSACHKADDVHKGALEGSCGDCHNPNAWTAWIFDHDKQTDFRLEGRHRDLRCRNCHAEGKDLKNTQGSCVSCHRNDDVHHGAFGFRCERCHNQDDFTRPMLRH